MTGLDFLETPAPSRDDLDALGDGLWPENVQHVSASSLKTFAACPEQYRRRYLLGEKQPPSAASLWGRADHAAVEFNMRQKIESGADLPLAEVLDRFAAQVDVELADAGGLSGINFSGKAKGAERKKVIADVKDRGVIGVERYQREVSPLIQPLTVEEKFSVTLRGIPVPIIGYLDLVADDAGAATQGRRIIDRKTSGKKVSKPASDWSMAAGIYQLARWLPHEWQVTVKTQNPYVIAGDDALTVKASPARKQWVERTIRSLVLELGWMYLTFGADEPWPAARALLHDWRCSYCGYADTCAWRKGAL